MLLSDSDKCFKWVFIQYDYMKGATEALFLSIAWILDRLFHYPNFVLISDDVNFIVVFTDVISVTFDLRFVSVSVKSWVRMLCKWIW